MIEEKLYTRENLKAYFEWREAPLHQFSDEIEAEVQASEFARLQPRLNGFVTFKSTWKGKRYFWIQNGEAYEIDPVACFLKDRDIRMARAKKRILKSVFGKGDKK